MTTFTDNESDPSQIDVARVVVLVMLLALISTLGGAVIGQTLQRFERGPLRLSADTVGTMAIILGIPAYIQPFLGAGSDLFPIMGYRRRSYFIIGYVIEVIGYIIMARTQHLTYASLISILLVIGFGGTLVSVSLNAVMVRIGNATGLFGTLLALQSLVPLLLGLTIAANVQAYSAQYLSIETCALIVAGLLALRIPLAFLIPERPISHKGMSHEHRILSKQADKIQNRANITALAKTLLSPSLWVLLGYVFYLILTPGINIQLYYFEKGYLLFNDYTIGLLVKWSSAGVLAGLLVFGILSRYLTMRSLVWGAFLMDCASYPAWYFMHGLWAARIILVITGFFGILYGMFLNTLAARATPKGLEGTIYSLIAAAIAFAGNLSNKLGTFLYDYFGPSSHHSIIHGWNMSLLVGFLFTVVAFIFIPFLPEWTKSNVPLKAAKEIERAELAEQKV